MFMLVKKQSLWGIDGSVDDWAYMLRAKDARIRSIDVRHNGRAQTSLNMFGDSRVSYASHEVAAQADLVA